MSKASRRWLTAALLPVLVLGVIIGCGGGGGGGGGGTGSTSSTSGTSTGTVTAVYKVSGASTTTAPTLSPGDQVTLAARVTNSGVTTAVTPYNFSVTGGTTVGTVTSSGLLTVGSGILPGSIYSIRANSSAGPVNWTFIGSPLLTQPIIVGIVESDASYAGVAGATITAYDTNGIAVGSGSTASDGTFSISVASTAVKFGVSLSGVDQSVDTYYTLFSYGKNNYDTVTPSCLPVLPALSTGNHRYPLSNVIYLNAHLSGGYTYPPPAPPGCYG